MRTGKTWFVLMFFSAQAAWEHSLGRAVSSSLRPNRPQTMSEAARAEERFEAARADCPDTSLGWMLGVGSPHFWRKAGCRGRVIFWMGVGCRGHGIFWTDVGLWVVATLKVSTQAGRQSPKQAERATARHCPLFPPPCAPLALSLSFSLFL